MALYKVREGWRSVVQSFLCLFHLIHSSATFWCAIAIRYMNSITKATFAWITTDLKMCLFI